ncbi:MAG: DotU family type IV/VI secretion system protein [Deltaproteobacteria bacterium]|nr:DotU family type IV/VI secretion system protein [Deltaproteobacteria bacterium]MBK8238077.1 DotU family type IV/VI secretion system protein [Deltaproteobacteria bacterium]MBK8718580.1 DotU family type IV/VI secretion system protein [Deltaproteobacteria bacterium]MBP7290839.1 DotU family type IV/VI secretion system protein [Nannocystaceae bacterium]
MPASAIESAFAPLLQLVCEIANAPAPPHPEALRQTLEAAIRDAASACAAAGVVEYEFRQALYPVVALVDELLQQVYAFGVWPPAALSLRHFDDNNAGVNFFARIDALVEQQRHEVLRVFALALGLGFQGQYAFAADAAVGLAGHRRRLAQVLGLSANVELPPEPDARIVAPSPSPIAFAPLGLAALAIVAMAVAFVVR